MSALPHLSSERPARFRPQPLPTTGPVPPVACALPERDASPPAGRDRADPAVNSRTPRTGDFCPPPGPGGRLRSDRCGGAVTGRTGRGHMSAVHRSLFGAHRVLCPPSASHHPHTTQSIDIVYRLPRSARHPPSVHRPPSTARPPGRPVAPLSRPHTSRGSKARPRPLRVITPQITSN